MTLQDRIDELVTQHGSLRAVARATEIDAGYADLRHQRGKA